MHYVSDMMPFPPEESESAASSGEKPVDGAAKDKTIRDQRMMISGLVAIAFVGWMAAAGGFRSVPSPTQPEAAQADNAKPTSALEAAVFPTNGIQTKARWGSVVPELVRLGVIDRDKFIDLFSRGDTQLKAEELAILDQPQENTPIVFTTENSRFTVDVLWAIGLAQKSDVLDKGLMVTAGNPPGQFASTGGWVLGRSNNAMDYYSKWNLLKLTAEDQQRVTAIAENIYRPCCGNSTAFPDCNHGMAMLGLIELMVSQGASDEEIYQAALAANTYWFPDTMFEVATYMTEVQKIAWADADPKTINGKEYMSSQGARRIHAELQQAGLLPEEPKGGGGCGA